MPKPLTVKRTTLRPKAPTPQEDFNANHIANAIGFSASIFFQGKHQVARFMLDDAPDAREQAVATARLMNERWGSQNGRRATVYAITPQGFTIFVCNPHLEEAA